MRHVTLALPVLFTRTDPCPRLAVALLGAFLTILATALTAFTLPRLSAAVPGCATTLLLLVALVELIPLLAHDLPPLR